MVSVADAAGASLSSEVLGASGARYGRWHRAWENLALSPEVFEEACPVCGFIGDPVGLVTLRALILRGLRGALSGEGWRYCRTQACPIVWYRQDPPLAVDQPAVRVAANVKTLDPSRPLCYCLRVDEASVFREVAEKGCCTTLDEVQRATRANTGKACHVTNPSGNCCERDVLAVIAKGLAAAGKADRLGDFKALEGCCVRPVGVGDSATSPDRALTRPG